MFPLSMLSRPNNILVAGPAHWADTSAGCGMKSQSPIDIDTSSAVPDDCLEPITMVNYDETANMKPRFRNNGHTGTTNSDSSIDCTVNDRNGSQN